MTRNSERSGSRDPPANNLNTTADLVPYVLVLWPLCPEQVTAGTQDHLLMRVLMEFGTSHEGMNRFQPSLLPGTHRRNPYLTRSSTQEDQYPC